MSIRPSYTLEENPIYTEVIAKLLNDDNVLAENSIFEQLVLSILNNTKAVKLIADELERRMTAGFEDVTELADTKAAIAALLDGTLKPAKAATADNAIKVYGKNENALSVSYAASAGSAVACTGNAATATRATTAATADNAIKAYGKVESALNVNYAASAGSAGSANAIVWGNVSGKPSTFPATAHNQVANTITAGTLPVDVLATSSTDYTKSRLRNAYFATAKPSSLANGVICFVYE